MIKATIEIDNGAHVVLLQDEEGNKMVTSVIPLVYMINSGKEIEVEGDNVMAGKIKDYIINLKENIDILEYIKEMVGDEPETILPVNFINRKSVHDEVATSSESKLTLDRELWYDVDGNFTYFYKKMVISPSPDVTARMNEAVDTWYYEVYVRESPRGKARLVATTTSWAAYVCGVPVLPGGKGLWLGVRAVAPDGKRTSKITWERVK